MDDNQLIEAFYISRGGKPHDPADIWFYESSWDMIMSVVDKIKEIYNNEILSTKTSEILKQSIFQCGIMAPKKRVYLSIIDFIKWYNQNYKK